MYKTYSVSAFLLAGLLSHLGAGLAEPSGSDPDLEPGFPVKSWHGPGSYHGGPAINVLVGNIDSDPYLEIIASGLAQGPMYAWKWDGSLVPGWPVTPPPESGVGYPGLGELDSYHPGFEVFIGYWGDGIAAYSGSGTYLPGWPRGNSNFITTPPSLADVDGDGLDEAFIGEEDWQVHAYKPDGSNLPGWPVNNRRGDQEIHTPAIADIDSDGDSEIITCSGAVTSGVYLFAYHHDGSLVTGYPLILDPKHELGPPDTFVAIGDVDSDGRKELIAITGRGPGPFPIQVRSFEGVVERSMDLLTPSYRCLSAPALADLNGDGIPEIVAQDEGKVYAWFGNGAPVPGWPVSAGEKGLCSSPVVGDIDGDLNPEVIVTSELKDGNGQVHAFNRSGEELSSFPKSVPIDGGGVSSVADIDLDGRNELIVVGEYWMGASGYDDKCWVYDLHGSQYGPVEWGQFCGNARHTGSYETPSRTVIDSADYDGNGTCDVAVFRPKESLFAVKAMTRIFFGADFDIPVCGDYNGDGTAEVAVFRKDSGLWALRGISSIYFGSSVDQPLPGDYNGDGTCDICVYRFRTGMWAIKNLTRIFFGAQGDRPVPGYYDGDAAKDIAVFKQSVGMWAINNISRVYFGTYGDEPLPGAYTGGDGWELGVFRPSSGLWGVRNTTRVFLGNSLDSGEVLDYNGDGMDEIAVFRATAGLWAVRNITRFYFGRTGDIPLVTR